jgi:glycerol-3-phosphate acyltransferase PlsY
MTALLIILFAYLLGSVPTGFLLGSLAGVDVRKAGSGNVGATNVARVAGKKHGILTLLGDTAKGLVPVFVALHMGLGAVAASLVALAAFLGHLYPVFLRFQGGKGVATALGALLALAPIAAVALMVIFSLVAAASRTVSLASMAAAAAAPAAIWLFGYPPASSGTGLAMALMVIWRHRDNIERLRAGVEPKFTR